MSDRPNLLDELALQVASSTGVDLALPGLPAGLLHASVIRPPSAGEALATGVPQLRNEPAIKRLPGVVAIVVKARFVGVVAQSADAARHAASQLRIEWPSPRQRSGAQPVERMIVAQRGDVAAALDSAATRELNTYRWPLDYALGEGSVTAIADSRNGVLTVWTVTTAPRALRTWLAALTGLAQQNITLARRAPVNVIESAGAHHAAADAALLSHLLHQPVCVELHADQILAGGSRSYLSSSVESGADASGTMTAYAMSTQAAPSAAPPLAFTLVHGDVALPIEDVAEDVAEDAAEGGAEDAPPAFAEGIPSGASAMPPYAFENISVARSSSAATTTAPVPSDAVRFARVFAHESHMDEVAASLGADAVEFRLKHLADERGAALIERTAREAGWLDPSKQTAPGVSAGRGFAYASVIENEGAATLKSWSAWVADVQVDTVSGDVRVGRVVVGQDTERRASLRVNGGADADRAAAAGPRLAAETIRQLTTEPRFDRWNTSAVDKRSLAVTHEAAHMALDIVDPSANGPVQLQQGNSTMLPAAAAIANAIHDAVGVRLREPPFSAERIRRALDDQRAGTEGGWHGGRRGWKRTRYAWTGALVAAAGALAVCLPWRSAIAPVAPPDPGFYSAETIEHGRLVAAAGDCAVCHTAPDGARNAGGLALDTPFGVVYSTNITPDVKTGIGNWSYEAFRRAMREGVHRDGRHLYPAFPYTSFAKATESDLRALYAYLMSQTPVQSEPPATRLAFPFNIRPLLAGWNTLFHSDAEFKPDATQSVEWNRGKYLVDGLGHCGACHTPRNQLGAEKTGLAYLAGGVAEGWHAPALTALSQAPVAWSEGELYNYLSTGYSRYHGAAAGPMAPVVHELAQLPDSDVRAMAKYLASLNPAAPNALVVKTQSEALEQRSTERAATLNGAGARLYEGACAVCHQPNQGPQLYGVKASLALNTNLHGASPDNLIRVMLNGIEHPPHPEIGYMPGFRDTLNDKQVVELTGYLRARFAPDKPAWPQLDQTVARLRKEAAPH
jgi:nicotinate dehydrogenase subunit B